jgi:hypothetical protein
MIRRDALFAGGDLRTRIQVADSELVADVQAMDAQALLAADPSDLATQLTEKYRFEVPEFQEDQIYVDEPVETGVDVSNDWNRMITDRSRSFYVNGTAVTFHAPFIGDEELMLLAPSTFSTMPPEGKVLGQELVWVQVTTQAGSINDAVFKSNLEKVKQYLGWVASDVEPFNAGLEARARSVVEERRQRLLMAHEQTANLGYRIRRRADAPDTYRLPTRRRRAIAPRTETNEPGWAPEPAMDSEVYEDVLRIVSNMVDVMERSPRAFSTLDEEALRDHLLVQLNGQFEGGASGETFNRSGKTDILVRDDGRVAFIAECKFWDGASRFTEAIDQLLSYLTLRDTKSAIFLFHRGKGLSSVLPKIESAATGHRAHLKALPFDVDRGRRFLLQHPEDAGRTVTVTVLAFQVPTS